MTIEVVSVLDDSTADAVAFMSHPITQVEYVLEANKDTVDKRQGKKWQSDEFGDKMVWMSEAEEKDQFINGKTFIYVAIGIVTSDEDTGISEQVA
jgi:hypothetical protein